MAGTVAWDPFWQGGMGLSIGYHAKTGKFDPAKEPKDHREFYGTGVTITRTTPQEFYDANIKSEPTARLERHLGPRQRPDPVQLTPSGRARLGAPASVVTIGPRDAAVAAVFAAGCMSVEERCLAASVTSRAIAAEPGGEKPRRWRLAAWAPLIVLVLLCGIIAGDQSRIS